ncbi:hypothetical protein ES703_45882 [subsurface metagenome]
MLKEKFSLAFFARLFVQFLQLIGTIFVARIAGPSVLGTVAFGLAFVDMFSFLGNFGLGGAHTKILSEGYDKDKCIGTFSWLYSLAKLLFLFFIVGYFLAQKYLFNFPFESREHEYVIMVFIFMIVVNTLVEIPMATFIARMEQAKKDIPEIIKNLCLLLLRIVVVLLGGTAIALAFANLFSAIIIIPILWHLAGKVRLSKYDKEIAKKYIAYGIPLTILSISVVVMYTLDKVLLQYFTDSEQVGYYTVGFRLGGVFLLIANSASTLFYPYFSKAYAQNDIVTIQRIINRYERSCFLFVMPAMILLSIYSDTIVLLFLGEQYISSIKVLSIIVIAQMYFLFTVPYGNLIAGMGKFKTAALFHLVNVVILAASMIMFVNPNMLNLKAEGAALAFFSSKIFLGSIFIVLTKKYIHEFPLKWFKMFIIASIMIYFGFNYVYQMAFTTSISLRILFPFVFFSIVYGIFFLFKLFNLKDIIELLSFISPGRLKKYISKELNIKD